MRLFSSFTPRDGIDSNDMPNAEEMRLRQHNRNTIRTSHADARAALLAYEKEDTHGH